jgi:GTPase
MAFSSEVDTGSREENVSKHQIGASVLIQSERLQFDSPPRPDRFMSFTIAIIGRPNVGKSTLFNRLVGQKLALVDDEPGVTRDRREGGARLGDLEFTVIDTAGLDDGTKGSLTARMQEQTEAAIGLADALMFVVDARAGLTPSDRAFAELARRADKPVLLVANKSEGRQGETGAMEAYALGLGDPIRISAEHGEGMSDLYDELRALMPEPAEPGEVPHRDGTTEADQEPADRPIRVAVVGRPNAGKSTLINRLLGEERLLTGAEAGITRDSISVEVGWDGRKFRVFDTAGLRRRSRIEEKLEKLSVADALRAVRFAEVVVLIIDARNRFEEQDLRIADLIEREGRALVIAVNKWDLMAERPGAISALRAEADHWLPQVKGVPVVAVSGLTGEGVDRLMKAVEAAFAVWNKRIPTALLNRWFEQAVDANPPPAVSGRRLKLNYITQAKARPPSFVLFCSRAEAVPQSYLRYLVNSLREHFGLPGTPVRISLREKANPFAHKRKRPS